MEISARQLRNNTAELIRRARDGDQVIITSRGRPVAALVPLPSGRRWLPRRELARRLETKQADAGLRADLSVLAGETTDDLKPPS